MAGKAGGVVALICAGVIALSLPSCVSHQDADLVITGVTLIDGTGAPPRTGTTILIHQSRIAEVVRDRDAVIPAEASVIDAAGKYVIPGLADMHVHFSLGAPLPRQPGTTETVLARKLYYGVTSILALGTSDAWTESIRKLRVRRSAGELQAPYIYGTGGHLTLQGTHPIYTISPPAVREAADSLAAETPMSEPVNLYSLGIGLSFVRTEEAVRKAVRERAEGGMDAIKITVESGPTPFGDDHPQMPVEMIRAIVDEAAQYGMPVLAHVTSLDELEDTLEGGAAGVVHAVVNDPLPDRVHADEMAAAGFSMIPTLVLFAKPENFEDPFLRETVSDQEISALADPGYIERRRQRWECCAAFDELLASMGMLHERGVPIAVGTDTGNPYVFPGYSVHKEMELLVQAGLTPMEAIRAATQRAAGSIGKDDEFGTIEPGKRADLLILGANPLDDIRNTRSLEAVVSEGRMVDRQALVGDTR
jgi:imidazolonepropionase-like amidohydrolase